MGRSAWEDVIVLILKMGSIYMNTKIYTDLQWNYEVSVQTCYDEVIE